MKVGLYLQPQTMAELPPALAQLTPESKIIAGGTDFLAQRNDQHWQTDILLSLAALKELQQIELTGEHLIIGAGCPHRAIHRNPLVQQYFPALAKACGDVGSVQIRNRGTIGGNLANASPAGDTIPCLFLYQAEVVMFDAAGQQRALPVQEFLLGPGRTALKAQEIISQIRLPLPQPGWQSAFCKLGSRGKVTISQIILTASWHRAADGLLDGFQLYIGTVSKTPLLMAEAPALVLGKQLDDHVIDALTELLSSLIREITPPEFDRDYKKLAVKGLVADLITEISTPL